MHINYWQRNSVRQCGKGRIIRTWKTPNFEPYNFGTRTIELTQFCTIDDVNEFSECCQNVLRRTHAHVKLNTG
jgi:hypothetical protein